MNKSLFITSLVTILSIFFSQAIAGTLSPEEVKGTYHLTTTERGQSKVKMEMGQMGNKTVLAIAACDRCPPAVYTFQQEQSSTLQTPVFFNTMGLYVIKYDDDSWIVVQPDGELGRKVWTKIGHANLYSKSANKAKSMTRGQIETYAINLSKKIMNQEVGEMAHAGGTYHLAVPQKHMGKAQNTYQIEFITEPKKHINIKTCDKCGTDEYQHLPEESAIAGVDVYRHATSYYLFDLKDGVLIYTFANAGGLGKTEWGKSNHYNVYSNNQAYIRQILTSKQKQDTIDAMMAGYFKDIKQEFEHQAQEKHQQQVANRKLPAAGLQDAAQEKQALAASKRWASAWDWKESLKNAYFISNDWAITRNKLTGVITGKIIRGIVTMNHPDGRCRYQHVSYRQDYNGSDYSNFHMTGVGPIYDLKCSEI